MSCKKIITSLFSTKFPRSFVIRNHVATRNLSHCQRLFDRSYHTVDNCHTILSTAATTSSPSVVAKRHKSGRKKTKPQNYRDDDDEDDDDDYDEQELREMVGDKDAKVISMKVSAMRVDSIVKATIGMARNKAEVALYQSKIRVNGERVLKKSALVGIGDYVDLVRGPSPQNPDFLLVTRVTILSAVISDDGYRIKFVRDKSLVIENYEDSWEPASNT